MNRKAIGAAVFLCCFVLAPGAEEDLIEFRGEGSGKDYAEARASAVNDIALQIGRYMFAFVKSDVQERLAYRSENGRTTGSAETAGSDTRIFSEIMISDITIDREFPLPRQPDGRYKIIVSSLMSKSGLEDQKDRYTRGLVESYAARMRQSAEPGGGLAVDVRSWQGIMESLEKNPLHKAIAYLDTAQGRVNLYDYLAGRISAAGGSIAFAPIPAQKARRGETIHIPIQVSSPLYASPGRLEYGISLSRMNGGEPPYRFSAAAIDTSLLPDGMYRGSAELRLGELSPLLRNIVREFSLEVGLPAPPEKTFAPGPLGGEWSGLMDYTARGQRYRDSYTAALYDDGSCWITVRGEDGAAQAALGSWWTEEGVFHLDCVFENPAIARLPVLRWISLYDLQNNNRRLRINIRPAPDHPGMAGLTLNKDR
jgi:hypothetical protein